MRGESLHQLYQKLTDSPLPKTHIVAFLNNSDDLEYVSKQKTKKYLF